MSAAIDIASLLEPIAPDAPCGGDLEYSDVTALDKLATAKPEQEIGGTLIPAEEPDWRAVRKAALETTGKTKDLRVLVTLIRALVETDGFPGLRDGIALLRALTERYWECVFPPLDPEDGDPTFRINTLSALCDPETMLRSVRHAPLVASRMLGRFSRRDIALASGELSAPPDAEPPNPATIDAAFMDADVGELAATMEAIEGAVSNLDVLETYVTGQVGAEHAPSFQALQTLLQEAGQVIGKHLSARGVGIPQPGEEEGAPGKGGGPAAAAAPQPVTGEIRGRDDVVRVLDRICEYYRRNEPSSPVPLLLERAKRLVTKDFMDIVNDLVPDGLPQARAIRGPVDEDSGD